MKKAISVLLVFVMLIGMTLALTGCGSTKTTSSAAGGSSAATTNAKLTLWINGKDSYISPDEQKLSQDQWYISQAIKRFEDANPGVTIELVVSADGETAHQTFKADAVAGTAPDMANLWTGQYTFQLEDAILDIKDLIPADDKKNITGWDAVTSTNTGAILGYPTSDNQVCFFLYNKTIIKECGLDFEKDPPRTIDAFNKACDAIAAKGYQPIASDDGSFPWFGCYVMNYWWAQQSGVDRIVSNCAGKTKFADDAGLISALTYYRKTMTAGYLNSDAVTSTDSWNKFCQGKVAMTPQVSSVIGDAEKALGADNIGVILPPDFDGAKITNSTIGGPGQDIVISKATKNPDLCIKFLSFLNSKDEVLKFEKVQQKVPTRTDITAADIGVSDTSATAKLFKFSGNMVFWIDNTLTSDVCSEYCSQMPMVLSGQMTPEDFAKDLDGIAAKSAK